MMRTMKNSQRGVSLEGTMIVLVLVIFVGISAMKLLPAYMEDASIKSVFNAIAHDPDMQNAQVKDIRVAFVKRAQVANITAVNAEDIEISKDASGISLSASYTVKKPLVANVSLLMEFNPSNSAK